MKKPKDTLAQTSLQGRWWHASRILCHLYGPKSWTLLWGSPCPARWLQVHSTSMMGPITGPIYKLCVCVYMHPLRMSINASRTAANKQQKWTTHINIFEQKNQYFGQLAINIFQKKNIEKQFPKKYWFLSKINTGIDFRCFSIFLLIFFNMGVSG